ncbi:MAG TPA: LysR family transcriptional regulator [Myxococcaceae bacterium]|nr:LysR family transcriptional regulator [Myxococcaceae bacterium]
MFDLVDRSGVELRYLETFAAVLEAGTFLAAARALGCSQSTVTLHIQELERDLGLPLFQREGRRVRLTAAGESLRGVSQRVRDSVQALRRAADELRDGGAGEVALGAVEPAASLRVTPVLAAFSRLRPRLRLRLEVSGTQTLSRQVAEGRLAFAVCSPPSASLGLSFQPCFRQRMALLLPRRHPLARQRRIRARDLASVRMLLTEHGCAYREATEAALRTRGVQVECALEIGSIVAAHAAVRDGLGLALVPVGPTLRAEAGLCLRELSDVDVTLVMGLARRDQPLATRAESALFAELSTALARG